ncbi:hypothetical protein HHL23_04595 [Chryseobacterium sp. RP-3-3]|uniref:Uncharacterized protein n=1 Tax=Chryseobacterium antibioticum TaxID=2728847 RepID=A0A7Y0AKJ4_9FLAO|nr:hypothetical protein [Chryseobacterium antibioticum]NML69069.1 hypothetical protein [Chryseobacterium antibioticum]
MKGKSAIPGNLLGRSKKEILEILGDEFSPYSSDEWFYIKEKRWWYKKYLKIYFDEKEQVDRLETKTKYTFFLNKKIQKL